MANYENPKSPRSPGTHIVGSCVMGRISFYRDPRTGTQYIGNWASRVESFRSATIKNLLSRIVLRVL